MRGCNECVCRNGQFVCTALACADPCRPVVSGCLNCRCTSAGRLCVNTCTSSVVARLSNLTIPLAILRDLVQLYMLTRPGSQINIISSEMEAEAGSDRLSAFISLVLNRQRTDELDELRSFFAENGVAGGEFVVVRSSTGSDSPALSEGQIAGIVIGATLFCALAVLVTILVLRRRTKKSSVTNQNVEVI